MKKISLIILVLISLSCKTVEVEPQKEYTFSEITIELNNMATTVQSGNNIESNSDLFTSMYNNRLTYPDLGESASALKQLQDILPIYTNCSVILSNLIMQHQGYINEDYAKLMAYIFTLNNVMLPAFEDFIGTFDKDDPTYQIRLEGLNTAHDGMVKTIMGFLMSYFIEDHGIEVDDIFSLTFSENLKTMIGYLPKDKKIGLLAYIDQNIKPNVREELKAEFTSLINTLD